jgi:hypothetical protein
MMNTKATTRSLKPLRALLAVAAAASLVVALGASTAAAAAPTVGFGFAVRDVSGFPADHGSVALTGGGAFNLNPTAGSVHAGGGFSCTSAATQGFFTGCLTGQGVRWDTADLLPNTMFKCTGAAGEQLKPASTNSDTVVLKADFYRAGDANDESFTAQMIVSTSDIAGDIQGDQNVWVQGVGCGTAVVHFGA